jgi:hypothetical protein
MQALLDSMTPWELAGYGALLVAGVILLFWLYYRGKP